MSKKTKVNCEKFITPNLVVKVSKKLSAGELKISKIISEFSCSTIDCDKSITLKDVRSQVGVAAIQTLTNIFGDRFEKSGVTSGVKYHINLKEGEDAETIINTYYGIKPKAEKKPVVIPEKHQEIVVSEAPKTVEEAKKIKRDAVESDPNYRLSISKTIRTLMVLDIIAENNGKILVDDLSKVFSKKFFELYKREEKPYLNQAKKIVEIFRPEYTEQLVENRLPTGKYDYRVRQISIVRPKSLIVTICKSLLNAQFTDDLRAGDRTYVFGLHEKYLSEVEDETEKYKELLRKEDLEKLKLKLETKKVPEKENKSKPIGAGLAGATAGITIPVMKKTTTTPVVEKIDLQKLTTVEPSEKKVAEVAQIPVENTIPDCIWKTNKELFAKMCVIYEITRKSFVSKDMIKDIAEKQYFLELEDKEMILILKTFQTKGAKLNQNGAEMQITGELNDFDITKTERKCLLQTSVNSSDTIKIFGNNCVNIISEGNYFISLDYSIESSKKLCRFFAKGEFISLLDEMLSTQVGISVLEKKEELKKKQDEARRKFEEEMARLEAESLDNMFV